MEQSIKLYKEVLNNIKDIIPLIEDERISLDNIITLKDNIHDFWFRKEHNPLEGVYYNLVLRRYSSAILYIKLYSNNSTGINSFYYDRGFCFILDKKEKKRYVLNFYPINEIPKKYGIDYPITEEEYFQLSTIQPVLSMEDYEYFHSTYNTIENKKYTDIYILNIGYDSFILEYPYKDLYEYLTGLQ